MDWFYWVLVGIVIAVAGWFISGVEIAITEESINKLEEIAHVVPDIPRAQFTVTDSQGNIIK